MAQQTTAQPGQADGFGQKVVHPLGQTTRPVLRHGIGRQRFDDGPIIFLHTGGAPALFAYADSFT